MNIRNKSIVLALVFAVLLGTTIMQGYQITSASGYSITISSTNFTQYDDPTITYQGGAAKDWIGIYLRGQTPGGSPNLPATHWINIPNTTTYEGTVKLSDIVGRNGSSKHSYELIALGEYDLIFLKNNGYTIAQRIPFTVTEVPPYTDTSISAPNVSAPYSFWVISDMHITNNEEFDYNTKFDTALKDIKNVDSSAVGIFSVGDLTNTGAPSEYDAYNTIINNNSTGLPTIFNAIGNHDLWTGTFGDSIERFMLNASTPAPYYEVNMGDAVFLILGGEEFYKGQNRVRLFDNQLNWFEDRLETYADGHKPVYVFLHQGFLNTTAGTIVGTDAGAWDGLHPSSATRLRALLNEYPKTIFFSGHTHWQLDHPHTKFVDDGGAIMFNTASTAYLWDDDDKPVAGSQGLYVQVTADNIVVKGRDFANSAWITGAEYTLDITTSNECSYGAWEMVDATNHSRECECGDVQTEAHTYGTGVVTPPTYTEAGYTTHTCTACDHSYTDSPVPVKTYTVTVSNDKISATFFSDYVLGATLTTPEVTGFVFKGWFKDEALTTSITAITAADLDANGDITIYAKWHAHSYGAWEMDDATNHSRECECGDVQTEAHTYGNWEKVDGTNHSRECDCGDVQTEAHSYGDWEKVDATNHSRECDCGDVQTEAHSYGAWEMVDATNHSRECDCGDVQTEAHTYNAVVTPPTYTEAGYTTYTCTACDHSYTDSPVPVKTYTVTVSNDKVEPNFFSGYVLGATLTTPEVTGFVFKGWFKDEALTTSITAITAADLDANGDITIYAKWHAHSYGAWEMDDATNHSRECECGEIETEAHTYNAVVTPPTYTEAGYTTHTCTACDHSYTDNPVPVKTYTVTVSNDKISATFFSDYVLGATLTTPEATGFVFKGWFTDEGLTQSITAITAADLDANGDITIYAKWHAHSYGAWEMDDATNHSRECECGEIETEAHTYGNWEKVDGTNHSRECDCGEVQTEAHTYGTGVVTPPTYTEAGYTTHTCTACDHSYTDSPVPVKTYTVTVSNDKISATFFSDYVLGATLTIPEVTGFVFEGWFKDEALTTSITAITAADLDANGNITIYVKWSVEEDTIPTPSGCNSVGSVNGGGIFGSLLMVAFALFVARSTKKFRPNRASVNA